jgi:osmotically-inducible protein OsmY
MTRQEGSPHAASRRALQVQITKALEHDSRTAKAVIDVSCVGGRATLLGTVGSAATKAAVLEVVHSVPGVIAIDEIAVKAGAR